MKNRVYIIAEVGVNHNGDRERAMSLIDLAADAGVDAVKFQTFDARKLVIRSVSKAIYQQKTTDVDEDQLDMLLSLELPHEWHFSLMKHAQVRGIDFTSTAFDQSSLEFVKTLNVPFMKIASGELVNGPLLWKIASTGKPLIISTGMATLSEVEAGLAVVAHALSSDVEPSSMSDVWQAWSDPSKRRKLEGHIRLLHCTSQYPTPLNEVNLRAMDTLRDAFGLEVGYSDHTEGVLMSVIAAARGAKVIEKHFTMDRSLPGPDHKSSLEPDELTEMVRQIRAVEECMGTGFKSPQPSEWDTRRAAQQQLIAARAMPAGHVIVAEDLTTARSGSGLAPNMYWDIIGTKTKRAYSTREIIES